MAQQSSGAGMAAGMVVAAVAAPTAVLVAAAVLVVALDAQPEPAVLQEIPPAKELPVAGAAMSAADDTIYEDLAIQDLCSLGGKDTVRFVASGARIQLTVDVRRGKGEVKMTGADRRQGEAASAAIDGDRTVAMEGTISRADGKGDPVQFILNANCNIPVDKDGKRAIP